MRIAVEGCLHGELDAVFSLLLERERREGVKIDLLLCCGDFQAVRNPDDLQWMKVPDKYKTMGSFYKYYSGEKVAPFLTVFIGGNHEASNHLLELGYGGWVAPNIYYLGYSGVVWFGGLRIGGLSGIFNPHHYHLGHHERLPFQQSMITSAYHVRTFEVFRLKQLTGNIDIFMSHDWPTEIYHHGNLEQLLRFKPYFRKEAMSNTLGSPAAKELLDHLQPQKWWSGHLHCRFEACYVHGLPTDGAAMLAKGNIPVDGFPMGRGILGDSPYSTAPMGHPPMGWPGRGHSPMGGPGMGHPPMGGPRMGHPPMGGPGMGHPPMGHPSKVTEFLALDKCLPKRKCLEVFDFPKSPHPKVLTYDPEWLAITKSTNDITPLNRSPWTPPTGADPRSNFQPTQEELEWVQERFKGDFVIPNNFQVTAPPLRDSYPWQPGSTPVADNPQTVEFCAKLDIVNNFSCNQERQAFVGRSRYFSQCPPDTAVATPSNTANNPDEIDLDDDDDDVTDTPVQPPVPPPTSVSQPCMPTSNPSEIDLVEGDDGDHLLSKKPTQNSVARVNPDELRISSLSENSGSECKQEGDEEAEDEQEEEEEEKEKKEEEKKEEGKKEGEKKEEEEEEEKEEEEEEEEEVVIVVEEEEEEGSSAEVLDTEVEVEVCLNSDEAEQDKRQGLGEMWSSTTETTAATTSPDQSPHSSSEVDVVGPPAKRAK